MIVVLFVRKRNFPNVPNPPPTKLPNCQYSPVSTSLYRKQTERILYSYQSPSCVRLGLTTTRGSGGRGCKFCQAAWNLKASMRPQLAVAKMMEIDERLTSDNCSRLLTSIETLSDLNSRKTDSRIHRQSSQAKPSHSEAGPNRQIRRQYNKRRMHSIRWEKNPPISPISEPPAVRDFYYLRPPKHSTHSFWHYRPPPHTF